MGRRPGLAGVGRRPGRVEFVAGHAKPARGGVAAKAGDIQAAVRARDGGTYGGAGLYGPVTAGRDILGPVEAKLSIGTWDHWVDHGQPVRKADINS